MSPNKNSEMDELITLAAAAEQLDVHYMTAYRYVRTGRMIAKKRSGKWWVTSADLAAVIAEGTGPRRRPVAVSGGTRDFQIEAFTSRLIAGDTAGCWGIASTSLSAGATPVEIYERLLCETLAHIGEQWSVGQLSVADEHRATATAYRIVGQMGPLFRHRGRRRGGVILASVTGDMHALPSALMADLLCDRRFEVMDLGANTPTESLLESAEHLDGFVGFGLCVSVDSQIETALEQVKQIRAAMPDTFVLIGGPAIAHSGRKADFAPHVSVVSQSAQDVCAAFDKLVASQAD